MAKQNNENIIYQYVLQGDYEIDSQGRVWRLATYTGGRSLDRQSRRRACERHRAEGNGKPYYQVRMMIDGKLVIAQAHRLVYRYFKGEIPEGLTVNHENGIPKDNRPENLTLMTMKEQHHHAMYVTQNYKSIKGVKHWASKVSETDVSEIRQRYADGETLKSIWASFPVLAYITLYHITRRYTWKHLP